MFGDGPAGIWESRCFKRKRMQRMPPVFRTANVQNVLQSATGHAELQL